MTLHRYVFYKDRPEWADVKPIPQYEGDCSVVRIAYSPEFVDAHDYLRAVLLKDERSERALEITTTVLQLNPANYTVWEYRRRILVTLSSDLTEELKFVGKLIDESSKNYQLWHHRQWVVMQLADRAKQTDPSDNDFQNLGSGELSFTESVIGDDSKHYHAWQHRRWAVTYFKLSPESELAYTESLIGEDMYNNSAWNHRFVTVTKDEGRTPEVLKREVEFTQRNIRLAPNNESSWNYLYGLLVPSPKVITGSSSAHARVTTPTTQVETVDETQQTKHSVAERTHLIVYPPPVTNLRMMRKFAEDLAASDPVAADSPALLGFLVEIYVDCIQSRTGTSSDQSENGDQPSTHPASMDSGVNQTVNSDESITDLAERAQSLCEQLALELDRIRVTYWRYRSRQIQALVDKQKQGILFSR